MRYVENGILEYYGLYLLDFLGFPSIPANLVFPHLSMLRTWTNRLISWVMLSFFFFHHKFPPFTFIPIQHPTLETPIDAVFVAILAKANTLQFYLGESLVHTCRLKRRPQI